MSDIMYLVLIIILTLIIVTNLAYTVRLNIRLDILSRRLNIHLSKQQAKEDLLNLDEFRNNRGLFTNKVRQT